MAKRKTGPSWESACSVVDVNASMAEEHSHLMAETLAVSLQADNNLSGIEYRAPDELTPSEFNEVFVSQKTDADWSLLRRAIEDARMVTDPLLITSDGTVISGHSRLRIASDLLAEGFTEFRRIPVRVFRQKLSREQERRAVYIANLARFQIDRDQKLIMIAQIYPDFFSEDGLNGRPAKGDTMSPRKKDVAALMKVSPRHVQREKQVVLKAIREAKARGDDEPTIEDIRHARNDAKNRPTTGRNKTDERVDSPKVEERDGRIMIDGFTVATINEEQLEHLGLDSRVVVRRLKDILTKFACRN